MTIKTPEIESSKNDGDIELSLPLQQDLTDWQTGHEFTVVGKPHSRLEGAEKVTGRAQYSADVRLSGQLYGAVLRCPHPHAKLISIDTSEAEALPGVHAVISQNDQFDIDWYSEEAPLFSDQLRFVGDEVAAVAAVSTEVAADALRLIKVNYEPLPFVTDMDQALADDAPAIHDGDNRVEEDSEYERGDCAAGLQQADITVENEYRTQTALHTALEAHGATAHWSGDELIVYESTQGVHAIHGLLCEKLGLPMNKVRVIEQHMGGGFGAKQTLWKPTLFAALLSRKAGRPVQLLLDREGENLATGNRNSTLQQVKLGASNDGKLTAIKMTCRINAGAYATAGEASNVAGIFQHLYHCENVKTSQVRVYTNTGPAVAFRAPGYVEACFALESAMDELAHKLEIDPLELRRINYTGRDQTGDKPWSSPDGLKTCYERLDEEFGWSQRKAPSSEGSIRRGYGLAAHEWMAGMGNPPAAVFIKLNTDGSADVVTGTQDIGTGTRTVLAQVAAEAIGLPMESVRLLLGDTAIGGVAPVSQGSFTVPTLAPAVRGAGENLRRQILEAAALLLETDATTLEIKDGEIVSTEGKHKSLTVADVCDELAPQSLQAHGSRRANPTDTTIRPFGALAAEVAVDTQTGEITVIRIVNAPDCGRILNSKTANSQVIGGVTQGIGFALTEERMVDHNIGLVLNADLEEYKIPTVADIPTITHAEVNLPDLNANNTGAKGLGELPLIPAAPAILNAIFDATGLRFTQLPINRARVLAALQAQQETAE